MGIWSLWLFVGAGFLIAELLTLSTTCLYVGIGALLAMCAAFLGGDWLATIVTFVASTALLFVATYRWRNRLIKALHKGAEQGATGMDALIGRTGTVFASTDSYRMRIDGDVWQVAPARHEHTLSPGEEVRVVGYDSIILKVERLA